MSVDAITVKVLIADGPCEWIGRIAELLKDWSVPVQMRIAGSQAHGLEIIGQSRVDIAFIGVDVPQLGGLELVRRLHRQAVDVPVVLLGGRSDRLWLEQALRLNVRTVLPRPIRETLVLDVICKTLDVRNRRLGWTPDARSN